MQEDLVCPTLEKGYNQDGELAQRSTKLRTEKFPMDVKKGGNRRPWL